MSETPLALTRDEALDILAALDEAATVVDDLDVQFALDGAVRILTAKLFPHLPEAE